MAKVFVSYSRRDIEFAKRLTSELQKSELDFWIDWEGIPPTVDWWKEIEKGIEEADVFVFLISPDSARSKICGQEIDCAIKNGKRLIPLLVCDLPAEEMPAKLSHINWIFFRQSDDFAAGLNKLLTSIHTDYEWVKAHRRLQVKALEWDRSNKERSFLLRGKDLQDAEFQLATNTSKEPHPTDLQREYVFASRKAADRQRTITTSISVAGVIALAALAVFGFVQAGRATSQANVAMTAQANAESAQAIAVANEQEAQRQKAQAEAESRRALSEELAAESKSALAEYPQRAQLLGLEALQVNLEAGEATRPTAQEALHAANARVTGMGLPGFRKEVSYLQFTSDNQWLVAGSEYSGEFHIWKLSEIDQPGYKPVEINLNAEVTTDDVHAYLSDQEKWFVATVHREASGDSESAATAEGWETHLCSLAAATGGKSTAFQNPIVLLDEDRTVLELQDGKVQFWDLNLETLTTMKSFTVEGSFAALSSDRKILATKIMTPDKAQVIFWDISQSNNPPQIVQNVELARGGNAFLFVEATSYRLAIGAVSETVTTLHLFDMKDPGRAPDVVNLPGTNLYYSLQSSPQGSWLKVTMTDNKCRCGGGHSYLINLQSGTPILSAYKANDFYNDFLLDGWYVYLDDRYSDDYELLHHYQFVKLPNEGFIPSLSYRILKPNVNFGEWRFITDSEGSWLSYGANDAINTDALVTEGRLIARNALLSDAQPDSSNADPWLSIPRTGFEDAVVLSATSPDGQWHAEGAYGGSLRLWNLDDERKYQAGQFIAEDGYRYLRLSSDGQWLVAGSGLWHLEKGLPSGLPLRFRPPGEGYSAEFSPDGHWLLYYSSGFRLINVNEFSKNPSLEGQEIDISALNPSYLAFSCDNRWLIAAGGRNMTALWNISNSQPSPLPLLIDKGLDEVVVSPDGRYMLGLMVSEDPVGSLVLVWEYPTSETTQTDVIAEWSIAQKSQISQNGYWLITQDHQLWDLRCLMQNTACEPFVLTMPEDASTSFSADSRYLVSVSISDQTGKQSFHIWDLENASGASRVAPTSAYEAASSFGWTSTAWDIQQLVTDRIYVWESGGGSGGDELGSYKIDYGIEVIRASSGSGSFQNLVLRGHEEVVTAQMTSPSGRYGITISPDSIKLWDLEALQVDQFAPAVNLPIETSEIAEYGFTMDERFLVVLLRNRELKFLPLRVDDLMTQACRSVGRNFIINEWQRYFLSAGYQRTCKNLPEHPSVLIEALAMP